MLLLCWTFSQILKILHSVKEGTGLFHIQKCIFFIYSPVQIYLLTTWTMILGCLWALIPLSLIFQLPIGSGCIWIAHGIASIWLTWSSSLQPIVNTGLRSSRFHTIFRTYLLEFNQKCSLWINSTYHNWKKLWLADTASAIDSWKSTQGIKSQEFLLFVRFTWFCWLPSVGEWIHISLSNWFCSQGGSRILKKTYGQK